MNILSIQSAVVYGHVGNGAAKFALERQGHEVWALPTVLLSSHAGYATVAGESLDAGLLARLLGGLEANGWLRHCDGVISGYLGHRDQAAVVAEAVRKVRAANPRALYCLDPVFGDAGRAYAKPGVAEAMARDLLPLADIVTPNVFELSSLTSITIRNADDARAAAERLGRPVVLATSVPAGDTQIATLAWSRSECWLATTPLLAHPPHGSGDLLAALFTGHRLAGLSLHDALARATGSVFHMLAKSDGAEEMPLIAEQDVLVATVDASAVEILEIARSPSP